MSITLSNFFGLLGGLLVLAYLANRFAHRTRVPDVMVLLLCGIANGLPLESNGLRVLVRVGWGRSQKNYGATYRSVQEALKSELPRSPERLRDAHLLLREHGKTLCKDKAPQCHECPVSADCKYAQTTAASFL